MEAYPKQGIKEMTTLSTLLGGKKEGKKGKRKEGRKGGRKIGRYILFSEGLLCHRYQRSPSTYLLQAPETLLLQAD